MVLIFPAVKKIYILLYVILYLHTYENYESNLKRDTFLPTDFSLLEQLLVKRCKNNSLKKFFLIERKGFCFIVFVDLSDLSFWLKKKT